MSIQVCAELCCQFAAACIVLHAIHDIILGCTSFCARQQTSAQASHTKRKKVCALGGHNDESLQKQQSGASLTHFCVLCSILRHM